MRAEPIRDPFDGEMLVAVQPRPGQDVPEHWLRRVHMVAGRALGDRALSTRQDAWARRIALRGRAVSSGVVDGLEATLASRADGPRVVVRPGAGLAASGDDVRLTRVVDLPIGELQVLEETATLGPGDVPLPPPAELPTLDSLPTAAREGAVFGLVLQPVVANDHERGPRTDACEADDDELAFADLLREDAVRVVACAWPDAALHRPAFGATRWRNRVAWAVLEAERRGVVLPWNFLGVPIGLLGFDPSGAPIWLDRHAVVRAGGRERRRALLDLDRGDAALWRARIEQFAEQLGEAESDVLDDAARTFRWLPPVGVLPRSILAADGSRTQSFFPASWNVDVAPVPLEQLDRHVARSAPLAAFDTSVASHVRVLVPVPEAAFDADLLVADRVDPKLIEALDEIDAQRTIRLTQRRDVRGKVEILTDAVDGTARTFDDDPDAMPGERDDAELTGSDVEDPFGTSAENGAQRADGLAELITDLEATTLGRCELERTTKRDDGSDETGRERLERLGLREFVTDLERRVEAANDFVDLGFLRVQTDIYRIRQLVLGNETASRLVTSPALADVVKQSVTAVATQDSLQKFFDRAKQALTPPPSPPGGASPGGGGTQPPPTTPPAGGGGRPTLRPGAGGPGTFVGGGAATFGGGGTTAGRRGATFSGRGFRATSLGASTRGAAFGRPGRPAGPSVPRGGVFGTPRGGVGRGVVRPPFASPPVTTTLKLDLSQGLTPTAPKPRAPRAKKRDIGRQRPIVGKALDFRTVSLGERLKEPAAPEAKNYATAAKAELYERLVELGELICLDEIRLPGFYSYDANGALEYLDAQPGNPNHRPRLIKPRRLSLQELRTPARPATSTNPNPRTFLDELRFEEHDLDPANGDEASFFALGVRAVDNVSATLRLVEGVLARYEQLVERCSDAIRRLDDDIDRADARLDELGDDIDEVRHDYAVALSLYDEAWGDVQQTNARRAATLASVDTVVFVRPRASDVDDEPPSVSLDPAVEPAGTPRCMRVDRDVPDELDDYLELLHDAPAEWFPALAKRVDRWTDRRVLSRAVVASVRRARTAIRALPTIVRKTARSATAARTRVRRGLSNVRDLQRSVLFTQRRAVAQLDPDALDRDLTGLSWREVRTRARRVLTVGDVLDGRRGSRSVRRAAHRLTVDVARAAGCLWSGFGAVEPALRLEWARRYSQHDGAARLANLAVLPGWLRVDDDRRRELQQVVDWLFDQIDVADREAVAWVDDLVRSCVLVAAHAPVHRIVSGKVAAPAPAVPGGRVRLALDPSKIRIGMAVDLLRPRPLLGQTVVAAAVVEDVGPTEVVARVVRSVDTKLQLDADVQARVRSSVSSRTVQTNVMTFARSTRTVIR